MYSLIVILIISYTINLYVSKKIYRLFIKEKYLSINYKGNHIPNSMGITIVFTQLLIIPVIFFITKDMYIINIIFISTIIALIGMLDDFIGNEVKGFKGHFNSFLKGELTTGFIKALIGVLASLFVVVIKFNNIYEILFNLIILTLSINTINLFDLRPGRGLKVYFLFTIILLLGFINNNMLVLTFSVLGATLAYFPMDLKGYSMLGDVGSNLLGFYMGVFLISSSINKYLLIIILLLINIISERISISCIINKNRILKYLDEMGR